MDKFFSYNKRLGIKVANLPNEWSNFTKTEQSEILYYWEEVRGGIPDRIKQLEHEINAKQALLNVEEDFERSCKLNSEIAKLASIINDLQILYRSKSEITMKQ